MDCLRYICQEVPYNYIDVKRSSYDAYSRFFNKMKTEKSNSKNDTLSFKQLIDIINTEYEDEQLNSNSLDYAGGYKI